MSKMKLSLFHIKYSGKLAKIKKQAWFSVHDKQKFISFLLFIELHVCVIDVLQTQKGNCMLNRPVASGAVQPNFVVSRKICLKHIIKQKYCPLTVVVLRLGGPEARLQREAL